MPLTTRHLLFQAAVHHGVDIVNGQAGLGDIGRHHHLGHGEAFEHPGLLLDREFGMQRQDDRLLLVLVQHQAQLPAELLDLLLAGLEDQHVAAFLDQAGGVGQQEAGVAPVLEKRGSRGRGW